MTAELIAFLILIVLHIRWAVRENEAEKQRDNIRKDLLSTLHKIVEAQNEFRPMVYSITQCLDRIEGSNG